MSNDITEEKLKKYKLDKNDTKDQEEAIELEQANKATSDITSNTISTATKLRFKIENILDFDLKFNSIPLERLYKKSYLPVTRFLFRKYLFFTIALTFCWIIYFFLHSDDFNNLRIGEIYDYEELTTNTTIWEKKRGIIFFPDHLYMEFAAAFKGDKQSYTTMVIYLITMCTALVLILIYLSIGELKESKYRRLEKKIKHSESKKQVNCKMAEEDLQRALKEVVYKEKEYQELSKRLNESYIEVNKSREIYSKISNPFAFLVIAFMFTACFIPFILDYIPMGLTPISHFVWFCESLLMLYLIFPFQLSIPILFGITFSIIFEILSIKRLNFTTMNLSSNEFHLSTMELCMSVIMKTLIHISVHLIGIYLKLSIQAIKRDTFLKVCLKFNFLFYFCQFRNLK